jgi:hypothetical protein
VLVQVLQLGMLCLSNSLTLQLMPHLGLCLGKAQPDAVAAALRSSNNHRQWM